MRASVVYSIDYEIFLMLGLPAVRPKHLAGKKVVVLDDRLVIKMKKKDR